MSSSLQDLIEANRRVADATMHQSAALNKLTPALEALRRELMTDREKLDSIIQELKSLPSPTKRLRIVIVGAIVFGVSGWLALGALLLVNR